MAVGGLFLIAAFLSVPIILGGQALRWLQSSVWPELSVLNSWWWLFEQELRINASWKGANKLVNWVLELPLALTVPVILVAVGGVLLRAND